MTITLHHTIVAVADRQRAAQFLTDLLGLPSAVPAGPFMTVALNDDLTLDFDDRRGASPGHYGFLVDEATFDDVLAAAALLEADFGSGPQHGWDRATYHVGDGRGVYVREPDGHSYEFFTAAP